MDRMADSRSRRTQNLEFFQEQNRAAADPDAETSNPDLDKIDEAVERAMRVYSPDEAMDLMACGAPGRSAPTERWQDFRVLMRRAPPTRATQHGIEEAERELAYRWSRFADPADEAYLSFLPFHRLIEHFTPMEEDTEPGNPIDDELSGRDDER
jgi:hypothetical protein